MYSSKHLHVWMVQWNLTCWIWVDNLLWMLVDDTWFCAEDPLFIMTDLSSGAIDGTWNHEYPQVICCDFMYDTFVSAIINVDDDKFNYGQIFECWRMALKYLQTTCCGWSFYIHRQSTIFNYRFLKNHLVLQGWVDDGQLPANDQLQTMDKFNHVWIWRCISTDDLLW